MDLLTKGGEPQALTEWRESWNPSFHRMIYVSRALSDVEYEAVSDALHRLPLIAKFSNGPRTFLTENTLSSEKFSRRMRKGEIVSVVYLPESLHKVGDILKSACEILQRGGCESYEHYKGLNDGERRPLLAREERALKWATIHMVPQDSQIETYREFFTHEQQAAMANAESCEGRLKSAEEIVSAVFKPEDAERLLAQLVEPYIIASFENLFRMYLGEKNN